VKNEWCHSRKPRLHTSAYQLLTGAHVAGEVSCLAQLGVPDLVEAAPKSAEELARQIGADPQALYRLMRATASVGVLSEGPEGKFSQTPMSAILRSNATPSLRSFAMMGGRDCHGRGWSHLEYCVRTGKQALDQIYGAHIFEFLKQHPGEGQIFHNAMTELSMIDGPAVAEAYNFAGIRSIVEVGGGHGFLLATILERNPHLRGTLYEVPHVVDGAKNGPPGVSVSRRDVGFGDPLSWHADVYGHRFRRQLWRSARCAPLVSDAKIDIDGRFVMFKTINKHQDENRTGFKPVAPDTTFAQALNEIQNK